MSLRFSAKVRSTEYLVEVAPKESPIAKLVSARGPIISQGLVTAQLDEPNHFHVDLVFVREQDNFRAPRTLCHHPGRPMLVKNLDQRDVRAL